MCLLAALFLPVCCRPNPCIQVFPHEYQRAMAEGEAIKKAEEAQKAAIQAAGGCQCLSWCMFVPSCWLWFEQTNKTNCT